MEKFYPAFVHKDEDSDFGISFPDFLGCVSAASDQSEILEMAQEALNLHIEGMLEDGEDIPEPSNLATCKDQSMLNDALFVILVPIRLPTKSKRYQVMLPEHLVAEIDHRTNNRSAFIAEAIKKQLTTT